MPGRPRNLPNVDSTCEFCSLPVVAEVEHDCEFFGPNVAALLRYLRQRIVALEAHAGIVPPAPPAPPAPPGPPSP